MRNLRSTWLKILLGREGIFLQLIKSNNELRITIAIHVIKLSPLRKHFWLIPKSPMTLWGLNHWPWGTWNCPWALARRHQCSPSSVLQVSKGESKFSTRKMYSWKGSVAQNLGPSRTKAMSVKSEYTEKGAVLSRDCCQLTTWLFGVLFFKKF
jgi:hypothetical protein